MPREPMKDLPLHQSIKLYSGEHIYGVKITELSDGIENLSFLIGKYKNWDEIALEIKVI